MKIAIIAWGNLVGDKSVAAGKWQTDGPTLPIEFSRISKDGRLTPVIDPQSGANNNVCFATSKFRNLKSTIKAFQKKEKVAMSRVGVIDVTNAAKSECANRHPQVATAIYNWAKGKGFEAVVYTALGRKFKDAIDVPFSPENARNYISGLPPKKRSIARGYIRKVAKRINTPVTELLK